MNLQIVKNGVVDNIAVFPNNAEVIGKAVVWDGDQWPIPPGLSVFNVPDAQIGWVVDGNTLSPPPPARETLAERKETLRREIDALVATRLDAGAQVDGGIVSMDDRSRTDSSAMGATALAVLAGAIEWPESYQEGWIGADNKRIPLPTPEVGLHLVATVGDLYARIRQNGRTLKDNVLRADTHAALDALDTSTGWPAV